MHCCNSHYTSQFIHVPLISTCLNHWGWSGSLCIYCIYDHQLYIEHGCPSIFTFQRLFHNKNSALLSILNPFFSYNGFYQFSLLIPVSTDTFHLNLASRYSLSCSQHFMSLAKTWLFFTFEVGIDLYHQKGLHPWHYFSPLDLTVYSIMGRDVQCLPKCYSEVLD